MGFKRSKTVAITLIFTTQWASALTPMCYDFYTGYKESGPTLLSADNRKESEEILRLLLKTADDQGARRMTPEDEAQLAAGISYAFGRHREDLRTLKDIVYGKIELKDLSESQRILLGLVEPTYEHDTQMHEKVGSWELLKAHIKDKDGIYNRVKGRDPKSLINSIESQLPIGNFYQKVVAERSDFLNQTHKSLGVDWIEKGKQQARVHRDGNEIPAELSAFQKLATLDLKVQAATDQVYHLQKLKKEISLIYLKALLELNVMTSSARKNSRVSRALERFWPEETKLPQWDASIAQLRTEVQKLAKKAAQTVETDKGWEENYRLLPNSLQALASKDLRDYIDDLNQQSATITKAVQDIHSLYFSAQNINLKHWPQK